MTRDEIYELALQCRVWIPLASGPEREACAQLVERNAAACRTHSELHDILSANAMAIRARGDA